MLKKLIKKYNLPVQEVKIAHNLAKNCDKILTRLGFENKKILLVCEENIHHKNWKFFEAPLTKLIIQKKLDSLILKASPLHKLVASEKNLQPILKSARNYDLILAIGSGTINDLCKLASAKLKIPYLIFATAASMNGYLSKSSSIIIKNHKKSLPATLPIAVYADLKILKSSPQQLTKAGIADSMCFYNCWFDWRLSNLILNTPLNQEAIKILLKPINNFLKTYQKYSLKDEILLKKLVNILLLAGLSMTISNGSYPASQSEHLIAHLLEMKYPNKVNKILHGLQIAATTASCIFLQKAILNSSTLKIEANDFILKDNLKTQELRNYFGEKVFKECQKETLGKLITQDRAHEINELLQKNWGNYKEILKYIYIDEKTIKNLMKHFKIPTSFKIFGITKLEYELAIKRAKLIRNRFTSLDFF